MPNEIARLNLINLYISAPSQRNSFVSANAQVAGYVLLFSPCTSSVRHRVTELNERLQEHAQGSALKKDRSGAVGGGAVFVGHSVDSGTDTPAKAAPVVKKSDKCKATVAVAVAVSRSISALIVVRGALSL